MKRIPTEIEDLILIEPEVHADERGFFVETFRRGWLDELEIEVEFVQQNHSRSSGPVSRSGLPLWTAASTRSDNSHIGVPSPRGFAAARSAAASASS